MTKLTNTRVLMIATDGYEEVELFAPRQALLDAGAQVVLASVDTRPIVGVVYDPVTTKSPESKKSITPDLALDEVDAEGFDAIVLPGGLVNPDKMRMQPKAIALIAAFARQGKPVAAICHAPWLLIEADLLRGRRATGWYSVRKDMENAGATVVDEAVVVDGNLITSRMPDDIPAFNAAVIAALGG
ncbi:General stress protein 18 [Bordetella ansorpii]|uniref:General stress protein 18 n=1 Tax=Bordetella ansorpii TaxID=288768 RepID=A0A157S7I7_9BORD|nr:type 1 glutamine amidotransferase domain-containing protein [Bordetella ansorpii]SAI66359.1 General stress protein 18 [Bordetella ansorpii]